MNTNDNNEILDVEYPNPFEEMENAIDEKDAEVELWKNRYMYTLSDFENYKKNAIKEKQSLIKYSSEKVVKDLLPIIDDFERALDHMDDTVKDGVTLIYNKFINILNRYNVTVIVPETGDTFTETMHEAISAIPASDTDLAGTIADCIERGYMLEDKVIRYAKVVVYN